MVDEERTDKIADNAHAEETEQADDDGTPLMNELLDADNRTDVHNQKEDSNCIAKRHEA